MASDGAVRFTREGPIWTCTFDNSSAGNGLTPAMIGELTDGLGEAARAADCAVLLIQGAGEQFSTGRARSSPPSANTPLAIRDELETIIRANAALVDVPCVT